MADNIPSLEDLLKSIQEEDNPQSSSALAVVPKKPEDLVEEDIDSQILSILGLEDVFDLTYEEYASLLKEAAVKGRMTNSQMTTESIELVTDEFKRVKNKTGRFKVKSKKVDINKVLNRRQPTPSGAIVKAQKLIPQTADDVSDQEKKTAGDKENIQEDLVNGIGNILESLITIRTILKSQNKVEEKSAEKSRKETENKKKKERERTLEKKKPSFRLPKMLSKPVDDFFGAIKRFFTNVLLGSVVLSIFKWLKNPANQKAIDGFANFMQNNAGLILGGLLAIAALPLASTILSFLAPITAIAIPAIKAAFAFLASPAGLAALAGLVTIGAAAKGGEMIMQKVQKTFGSTGVTKGGTAFNLGDINALKQEQEQFITQNKYSNEVRNKLIKPYDDLLEELRKKKSIEKDIENINRNIAAMPQQEWRWKPELEKKQKKLLESSKKTTELFGKLGITDANLKQSQMRRGGRVKDETFVDPSKTRPSVFQNLLGNTQRLLGISQKSLPPLPKTGTGSPSLAAAQQYGAPRKGGRRHAGVDFDAGDNDTFYSRIGGEVIYSANAGGGYGNVVDVYNDELGVTERIAEGSKNLVKVGQRISPGIPVQQGTHQTGVFHYEIRKGKATGSGSFEGTLDPLAFLGNPTAQTQVAQSSTAKIAQTKPSTPSIPSPTGRGNIVPLPIPVGSAAKQPQSNSAPLQSPVPRFSSEDPNNMTTMVVKSIYNVVG